MSSLCSVSVLRLMLSRYVAAVSALDIGTAKGLALAERYGREMVKLAKGLREIAEMELRARMKSRLLADYGWRWKVICELGGYLALDRWSRLHKQAQLLRPVKTPPRPSAPVPRSAAQSPLDRESLDKSRKASGRARTDSSGWFRLAPIPRGPLDLSRRAAASCEFRLATGVTHVGAANKIKPIPLTAQELDLRTPPLASAPSRASQDSRNTDGSNVMGPLLKRRNPPPPRPPDPPPISECSGQPARDGPED
jgi:hypothetical protein